MLKYLVLLLFVVTNLFSQNFQYPDEQKFLELTVPGKEHEILTKFTGKWKQNILMKQTTEELPATGIVENKIIYSGRFLEMDALYNFSGYPMEGKIIIGYNRHISKYFLFGIDSYDTKPLFINGEFNNKTQELVFNGTEFDPKTKKNIDFKIVLKIERENKYTYKVYNIFGKNERLIIEQHCIKIEE
ncbi:MAG: DUF1579 domain-containing protein [Candidatus Kapabacteria bacterium]|nr:DUF1579 domain-containing protein [Candidatus Kapabacteria bacterium]